MRTIPNPRAPHQAPPELEPAEAFAEYTGRYGRLAPKPDAGRVAATIGRKLCAGRPGGTQLDGAELLAAIEAPPDDSDISGAVPAAGAGRMAQPVHRAGGTQRTTGGMNQRHQLGTSERTQNNRRRRPGRER